MPQQMTKMDFLFCTLFIVAMLLFFLYYFLKSLGIQCISWVQVEFLNN